MGDIAAKRELAETSRKLIPILNESQVQKLALCWYEILSEMEEESKNEP